VGKTKKQKNNKRVLVHTKWGLPHGGISANGEGKKIKLEKTCTGSKWSEHNAKKKKKPFHPRMHHRWTKNGGGGEDTRSGGGVRNKVTKVGVVLKKEELLATLTTKKKKKQQRHNRGKRNSFHRAKTKRKKKKREHGGKQVTKMGKKEPEGGRTGGKAHKGSKEDNTGLWGREVWGGKTKGGGGPRQFTRARPGKKNGTEGVGKKPLRVSVQERETELHRKNRGPPPTTNKQQRGETPEVGGELT